MNYTTEKGEKSTVKITITLDKIEWDNAIETAYEKGKSKYSIPGFRKGKVPKKVLESMYGAGLFYEDAINNSFPEYYSEVLDKETEIYPVDRPELDIEKIDADGLVLKAIITVKPELKLGNYKGISFNKVEYNVKDEDIQAEISKLQERNARFINVEDRASENGDSVVIDYSGTVDNVKFDGGTAEKQTLVLGSNQFIPGFEEQVVGMTIGMERDITVKFPEEYHAENLKGKEAVFSVKLHEIKKKELPEVNDEFIKDSNGAESLEAFKAETKEKLANENTKKSEAELENEIIKNITESSEVEIPEVMVLKQVENMIKDAEYRFMYQGIKLEDYLQYIGQTMDEYKEGLKVEAEKQVKSQLVIDKILAEEKITATNEDMDAKIKEMAESSKKSEEEFRKTLSDYQKEYFEREIIIKKLFENLKSNNEIKVEKK